MDDLLAESLFKGPQDTSTSRRRKEKKTLMREFLRANIECVQDPPGFVFQTQYRHEYGNAGPTANWTRRPPPSGRMPS